MEIIKEQKNKLKNTFSMTVLKNKELRIAAYARVSTEHEDQKTSIDSQQKYYTLKVNNNPNWTLTKILIK